MIKREWLTRGTALLICAVSVFSLLAGCNSEDNIKPASSAPVEVENVVPDRGMADRSDLMYLDSIERYKKTDWTANWIWTEGCAEDSYVAFRKTFTLDQAVPSATAFISAVDKYVLWVNGELVVLDGALKRGPTPYDSYYDTVELTNLKQGENTIALLVACGLCPSNGEARRLIQQGGMMVNDKKVTDIAASFDQADFQGEGVIIKKGKKVYHRVLIK